MAIFFFLVGLELKREILDGELSDRRKIILPGQAQPFLAVRNHIHNLFRVGRHLLGAANNWLLRNRSY